MTSMFMIQLEELEEIPTQDDGDCLFLAVMQSLLNQPIDEKEKQQVQQMKEASFVKQLSDNSVFMGKQDYSELKPDDNQNTWEETWNSFRDM